MAFLDLLRERAKVRALPFSAEDTIRFLDRAKDTKVPKGLTKDPILSDALRVVYFLADTYTKNRSISQQIHRNLSGRDSVKIALNWLEGIKPSKASVSFNYKGQKVEFDTTFLLEIKARESLDSLEDFGVVTNAKDLTLCRDELREFVANDGRIKDPRTKTRRKLVFCLFEYLGADGKHTAREVLRLLSSSAFAEDYQGTEADDERRKIILDVERLKNAFPAD